MSAPDPARDAARESAREEASGAEPEILTHVTPGYWAAWASTRIAYTLYFRERLEGREHLPPSGGVLIVANHQSFLDIPLVSHVVPRHVSFVARDTLAQSRPLAWLMRTCGAVLIKRGAYDRAALREAALHLERGDVVAMFPEGTRTPDGSVQPFRSGAVVAARLAKVPIVPCAIRGAFQALGRGKAFPRPAKMRATLLPPIDSALPDALERARAAIIAVVGDGRS